MPSHLNAKMRDILILHIDGPVDIDTRSPAHSTVRALLERGLLRNRSYEGGPIVRGHQTSITEQGRAALAKLLGEYADALVRAGMLERSPSGGLLVDEAREVAEAKNLDEAA